MRTRRAERRSTPNTRERDIARLLRKLSRVWNVGALATVPVSENPRLRRTKGRLVRKPLTIQL